MKFPLLLQFLAESENLYGDAKSGGNSAHTEVALSDHLDFVVLLFAILGFFIVGLLWSASTWRHGFDLGWLVVAFSVARGASTRIEKGKIGARDYAVVFWLAVPGFVLEALSDLSLHNFFLHERSADLVQFAVFSCLFLIFIATVTAGSRFGVGIQDSLRET